MNPFTKEIPIITMKDVIDSGLVDDLDLAIIKNHIHYLNSTIKKELLFTELWELINIYDKIIKKHCI